MVIKALCEYARCNSEVRELVVSSYSWQGVTHRVWLDQDGNIIGVTDIRVEKLVEEKGKKKSKLIKQELFLPREQVVKGSYSYYADTRAQVVFGLSRDDSTKSATGGMLSVVKPKEGKEQVPHDYFKQGVEELFKDCTSPVVRAYYNFVMRWEPSEQVNNEWLKGKTKEQAKDVRVPIATKWKEETKVVFGVRINGTAYFLEEDEEFRACWDKKYAELTGVSEDTVTGTCAVYGEEAPLARLHNKVQGLVNGGVGGDVMCSYKHDAFVSYEKEKGSSITSGVSTKAMLEYTTALNWLLKRKNRHCIRLDDMSLVYFAMKADDTKECDLFSLLSDPINSAADIDNSLREAAKELLRGRVVDIKDIDTDVTFYVMGLVANSGRIMVKFCERNSFGKAMRNVLQHQKDLGVWRLLEDKTKHANDNANANEKNAHKGKADTDCPEDESNDNDTQEDKRTVILEEYTDEGIKEGKLIVQQVSMGSILHQLQSPKASTSDVPSSFVAAMYTAMYRGTQYPQAMLDYVVRRVKTDKDDPENRVARCNYVRAGIIKAYINRKNRKLGKQEEFKMGLDKENKTPAYLCGRLFAVLVGVQKSALGSVNSSIKDAYFTSACVRPAVVFSRLMTLSQAHLKKIKSSNFWEEQIREILDKMGNEFPQVLTLNEQGVFILGYYHQQTALKTKKEGAAL